DNEGTSFRMSFRGGDITLLSDAQEAVATPHIRCEIWWTGLECQKKQEGKDEMYGVVGVLIPGTGLSNSVKFPDDGGGRWDMGDDVRIINTGSRLYNGPPTDIVLTVSLIEHDSGDTTTAKRKIADVIAKAAEGLAAYGGIPAETLAANQGFINDLSL